MLLGKYLYFCDTCSFAFFIAEEEGSFCYPDFGGCSEPYKCIVYVPNMIGYYCGKVNCTKSEDCTVLKKPMYKQMTPECEDGKCIYEKLKYKH